jgi:hypothetical protein
MRRFISIALAVTALLTGCSTVIDRSTQDITVETPGATGAQCLMEWSGHRMRVLAPKTVKITKDEGPMTVTCLAPGNREKTVVIEPITPSSYSYNFFTGFLPGALYDRDTGAMWLYPEKIVVDFTGMPVQDMPKPDYQQLLDANPGMAGMEEFRPGRAALQRDKDYKPQELQPRRSDSELFSGEDGGGGDGAWQGDGSTPAVKAGSNASAEDLTRQMNPGVFKRSADPDAELK